AAEHHMLRALEINPGYATAHQWYAHDVLSAVGRLEEAEAALARARECDPLSIVVLASSAENLMMQRRPLEALEAFQKALEFDPYFPRGHFAIGRVMLALGRKEEAVAAVQRGAGLIPGSPLAVALTAHVYAAVGRKDEARAWLADLEEIATTTRVSPYLL